MTKGSKTKTKQSDWELEATFDRVASLEELINSPPFKEASDSQGVSISTGVRIPGWLQRRISFFTEMKGTPYQIASDVTRDAIFLGLRILAMRYHANPEWMVEAKIAKAIDKVGTIRRIRAQVKDLSQGLEEMVANKDKKQAIEGFEDFIVPVLELEDDWHKQKLIQSVMDNKITREILNKCSDRIVDAVKKIHKATQAEEE